MTGIPIMPCNMKTPSSGGWIPSSDQLGPYLQAREKVARSFGKSLEWKIDQVIHEDFLYERLMILTPVARIR